MDVLAELFQFRETGASELLRKGISGNSNLDTEPVFKAPEPFLDIRWRGRSELDPKLKPPSDRAVKQLGMVGRGDDNNVAGKGIDLEQKGADNTLDLTRFVYVSSFFSQDVKLVEE